MPRADGGQPSVQDEEILVLLLDRKPDGLRLLLDAYGGRIRDQLGREFQNLGAGDLDEAMNDAAQRVWERCGTFDMARGTLRAWFHVIARRCVVEIWRQQQRRGRVLPLQEDEAVALAAPSVEPETDSPSDFVSALRTCLQSLRGKQRAVIEADLQSPGVADAATLARELDTTRNAIYAMRNYARKALRRCLEKRGFGPDGQPETNHD